MASENSFDVGCKVDAQELSNALDLARKEIDNRFDFKGATVTIKMEPNAIQVEASDDMRMKQTIDILQTKMHKRGLNLKAFQFGELFFRRFARFHVGCSSDSVAKNSRWLLLR